MKIVNNKLLVLFAVLSLLNVNLAQARLPAIVNGKVLPSLADMLEEVTPAVVNISTQGRKVVSNVKDPVYSHFFGKRIIKKRVIGLGSGIIVDALNGYIVTNAHVIEGAEKITVTLKDKRQFYALVIGKDLKTDIAIIRIQPDRLTNMKVINERKLRVGDFVVAIGNPFGLGQSVTSGIVSALGRTGLGIEDYEDFIQTDALINSGNSGGALVNLHGELVGINTAILGGKNGGSVGIGFAIPSSMIINITDQIIQNGQVERGQLGMEIQDVKPQLVKVFKLKNGQGALISKVLSKSPADKAGIKAGDIITRINGTVVINSANMKSMVGNLRMDSQVTMEYMRNGLLKKGVAKVGEVNKEFSANIRKDKGTK